VSNMSLSHTELIEQSTHSRLTQLEVNAQLDILSAVLKDQLNKENNKDYKELDEHLRTLNAIKSKVTVVSNVLQSAQDRLVSMQARVTAAELKKKAVEQQPVPSQPQQAEEQ